MKAGLQVGNFTAIYISKEAQTHPALVGWFCLFVCFTLSTSFHLAITGFPCPPLEDILLAMASGPHGEFHRHLYRFSPLVSGSAVHCLSCFLFPVFGSFFSKF